MSFIKKPITLIFLVLTVFIQTNAQAAMVGTPELLLESQRSRVLQMIERDTVREQLKEMGIDHQSAQQRVNQMTAEELTQLNGQINKLPAGAASTTELLLIIIIIVLLI